VTTADDIREIAKSIGKSTIEIDDALETISDFLSDIRAVLDRGLKKRLDAAVEAIRDASKSIDSDADGLEGAAEEVDGIVAEFEELRAEAQVE
jgi:methyl-accepting chemotaxis protein